MTTEVATFDSILNHEKSHLTQRVHKEIYIYIYIYIYIKDKCFFFLQKNYNYIMTEPVVRQRHRDEGREQEVWGILGFGVVSFLCSACLDKRACLD
jgi:hypothetical protein